MYVCKDAHNPQHDHPRFLFLPSFLPSFLIVPSKIQNHTPHPHLLHSVLTHLPPNSINTTQHPHALPRAQIPNNPSSLHPPIDALNSNPTIPTSPHLTPTTDQAAIFHSEVAKNFKQGFRCGDLSGQVLRREVGGERGVCGCGRREEGFDVEVSV